jgi:hypothetical protein
MSLASRSDGSYARSVEKPNTFKAGTRDGQSRRTACNFCGGNVTQHTVRASVTETEYVEGGTVGTVETDYEVVQCDACQTFSFREFWCTSNQDPDYHEFGPEHTRVFPPRLEGRPPLTRVELPSNIDAIYRETHWALCSGSVILAGIGMRAIVEAVCAKKRARGKDLEKRIDNLVELGVLSKNDAKVLHRLRDLGNQAAHDVKPLDSNRLKVAMDVVEQLLKQLFYVDDASVRKHLPRKRKKPKAKPADLPARGP